MHTPCVQYGTCILRSNTLHAMQISSNIQQISHVHLPDQCTAAYPSVVIRFMTPPQYAWTLPMVPEMQHQNPLMLRDHQMMTRISRQYLWMMNIGQQKWFQKEHSAYMRMDYPITCAHTHVLLDHNGTTSYIDSLDLSDISDIRGPFSHYQ